MECHEMSKSGKMSQNVMECQVDVSMTDVI
jgi:hypothetical protein